MTKIRDNETAPDFTLTDTNGQSITLSDFQGGWNVVLVFNRGFM
jgi:peroxiredoxin